MELVLLLLWLSANLVQGHLFITLDTPEETLIVSKADSQVLCVNKRTGDEHIISLPAIPGKGIALNDTAFIFTFSQQNRIAKLNLKDHTVERTTLISSNPVDMVDLDGKLFILNSLDSTLSVLDQKTLRSLPTLPVRFDATKVYAKQDQLILLSMYKDWIVILDPNDGKQKEVIPTERWPQEVIFKDDRAFVLNYRHSSWNNNHGSLLSINLRTLSRAEIDLSGFAYLMKAQGDYGYILQHDDTLSVISLSTARLKKRIKLPFKNPHDLLLDETKAYIFFQTQGAIGVLDLSTHDLIGLTDLKSITYSFVIGEDRIYVDGTAHGCMEKCGIDHNYILEGQTYFWSGQSSYECKNLCRAYYALGKDLKIKFTAKREAPDVTVAPFTPLTVVGKFLYAGNQRVSFEEDVIFGE